jgi:hypothetical protein
MDILQQALNEATESLPSLFLENLIAKKLRAQGITAPKTLPGKIAKHILGGHSEPFVYKRGPLASNVNLDLKETDLDEMTRALERFCKKQIPQLLPHIASRISKRTLKDLKSGWEHEQTLQEADLSEFRKRLEERWGKPLGQLRMLLTMSREWCQAAHNHANSMKRSRKKQLREILVRLLVRACQVTDEIICLLENGFSDGAMARWRTLHEIAVVTVVISQHGESIAALYVAHQAVESKRALNKYASCCGPLGYKPLSARAVKKITKAYDEAVAKYGKDFDADYGWAAIYLKKKRMTFADLEAEAGRAEMRSYYQMGNDNVHAGVKSIFVRLGLLDDYSGLLAGRSNAGLMEPGQNAAHTLTQISALVCLPGKFDDLVIAQMIHMLRNEIPRSFYRAHNRLRRDDKKCNARN